MMMEAARTSETSVDYYFTRQYIPEDNSELNATIHFVSPNIKLVRFRPHLLRKHNGTLLVKLEGLIQPARAFSASVIRRALSLIALLKVSDEIRRKIFVWVTPETAERCSCTLAAGT
jgi:hypothetical protein